MQVVSTCPSCGCQYGWEMNQVEGTPDGGIRPGRSPDCPKCGYDVTCSNKRAPRNLHWYACAGDVKGLQRLLQPNLFNLFGLLRASVDARNPGGFTPLINAAQYGNKEAVAFLLDNGADINAETKGGATALGMAQQYQHPEIAELLKARGAKSSTS